MAAPKPKNERTRLKVLWQYEVLDTVPEEMFDDLTELAASICGAPMAMVSLVDEDRQWFKSALGMNQRQTPRDISFCAHAICQPDLFVVSDTLRDRRFRENPMVVGAPHIRFYAGSPLITADGYALGTLCVMDIEPRKLTPFQRRALQLLARVVVSQLELRRQVRVPVTVGKIGKTRPSAVGATTRAGRVARRKRTTRSRSA
jgi:GAF domain-containing protein